MWTCEIRRDAAVFEELASWWESCPGSRQYPYLRHDWFRIWHEAFVPGGAKLEVEVWRRDGEVAAVLPLWRRGPRGASLSNSHSEVFDLITAEDEAYPVVANHLRRRPMTRLFRLDGSSPLLRSAGSQWYVDREIESLFIDLSAGYDAVWSGFSKNLRSNLRRNQHKLERLGELTFVDNADGLIDGAFEICLDLERRGWKGRNGTAILSRPETTRFYRGLAELAREKGWLRLSSASITPAGDSG
jgi:CelD/BcsL family acetyltransferase involved in cellulose biosynthesis